MCVCREFLIFDAHELNMSYQIWVGFIFVYQKYFQTFKISFWVQNRLLNLCSSAVDTGYCVVKKLVWNIRIKAFWFINILFLDRTRTSGKATNFLINLCDEGRFLNFKLYKEVLYFIVFQCHKSLNLIF